MFVIKDNSNNLFLWLGDINEPGILKTVANSRGLDESNVTLFEIPQEIQDWISESPGNQIDLSMDINDVVLQKYTSSQGQNGFEKNTIGDPIILNEAE